jgi:hypothetical protein
MEHSSVPGSAAKIAFCCKKCVIMAGPRYKREIFHKLFLQASRAIIKHLAQCLRSDGQNLTD